MTLTLESALRDAELRSELRRGDVDALERRVLSEYDDYLRQAPSVRGMTLEEFMRWPLDEPWFEDVLA